MLQVKKGKKRPLGLTQGAAVDQAEERLLETTTANQLARARERLNHTYGACGSPAKST
jgi:hypothetical protein